MNSVEAKAMDWCSTAESGIKWEGGEENCLCDAYFLEESACKERISIYSKM